MNKEQLIKKGLNSSGFGQYDEKLSGSMMMNSDGNENERRAYEYVCIVCGCSFDENRECSCTKH